MATIFVGLTKGTCSLGALKLSTIFRNLTQLQIEDITRRFSAIEIHPFNSERIAVHESSMITTTRPTKLKTLKRPTSRLLRDTALPLFLVFVVILLCLEIVGTGAGLSYSLGRPVVDSYAKPPILFVRGASSVITGLPFLSFGILAAGLIVGGLREFRSRGKEMVGREQMASPKPSASRRVPELFLLILATVVAGVLVWLPRSLQSLPIGSDTLYYMSVVETMKIEGPFWALQYTDKPLLYLVLYFSGQWSGLATADLFRALPACLAVSATLSSWYLAGGIHRQASGFVALMTAVSIPLMRTSIDLYASFFALILLFLVLGIYFRYRENIQRRQKILLMLGLVATLLSYWFVWVLILVVLTTAEISLAGIHRVRLLIEIFLPSILALGIFIAVSISNPPPVYWGLGSSFALYLGRSVTPLGAVSSSITFVNGSGMNLLGQDNLVMPILAVVGLIFLRPRSFPFRALYVWGATMLAFSLLSSTGTHAALLFPLPILAGFGLGKIVESL